MATITPLRRARAYTDCAHSGFVRFDEHVYLCDVTDMSSRGATLTFKSLVKLPGRFALQVTTDGRVIRQCCVTWDQGVKIGVIFVFDTRSA
jgi:hypothetical protein